MIAEFDAGGFDNAMAELPTRVDVRLQQGLEATCEAIAARARQTTSYQDRTTALRQSTQAAGVTRSGDDLVGIVSFAARSKRGKLYGLFINNGTRFIRARKFIDDAIAAQDGRFLEAGLAAAFVDCGFQVRGG